MAHPPHSAFDGAQTQPALGIRKQLSKEGWDDLKPLIQRLYIEESRTFAYIANILRENHNFNPTKKQFDDRTRKWGIRKNTKGTERKSILQNLQSLGDSSAIEISGRRHNRQKLERWQREFGGPSLGFFPASSSRVEAALKPGEPRDSVNQIDVQAPSFNGPHQRNDETFMGLPMQEENCSNPASNRAMRTPAPTCDDPVHIGSTPAIEAELLYAVDVDQPALGTESEVGLGVYEMDSWPFNHWANVSVIGSPKLTRLFENLEIEMGEVRFNIESINLPPPSVPFVAEETEHYIAATDLAMIPYSGNSETWSGHSTSLTTICIQGLETVSVDQQANRTPFHFPNSDAWLPSGAQIPMLPSPFNKVYMFPATPNALPKLTRGAVTFAQSSRTTELESKTLLLGLTRAGFAASHPAILRAKWSLADASWNQGKYKQAKSLYKTLFFAYKESDGADGRTTLAFQVKLALAIQYNGRAAEAREMLHEASTAIRTAFGPHHELMRSVLEAKVLILQNLGDLKGSENTARELVQTSFAECGLRHPQTMVALRGLGKGMSKRAIYTDSARLLEDALQLYQQSEGTQRGFILTLLELARNLTRPNRFDEAIRVYRSARELAQEFLGNEDILTLGIVSDLGRALRMHNLLQESEEILSSCVEIYVNVYGEDSTNTLWTMHELGETLCKRGRCEEAVTWFERCFRGRLKVFGLDYRNTVVSCEWLGYVYESQNRYEDALTLYHEFAENIRVAKGDNHPAIAKLQQRIDEVKEALAKEHERKCEEIDTDGTSEAGGESEMEGESKMGGEAEMDEGIEIGEVEMDSGFYLEEEYVMD